MATTTAAAPLVAIIRVSATPWHLDHRDDRLGTLGPAHALCNLRAAAAKANGKRKPHKTLRSRVWWEPIPEDVELTPRAAREYYGRRTQSRSSSRFARLAVTIARSRSFGEVSSM